MPSLILAGIFSKWVRVFKTPGHYTDIQPKGKAVLPLPVVAAYAIFPRTTLTLRNLSMTNDNERVVKDSNGTRLHDGDSVTLIKDLKVKGTSTTLKRGTLIKNIRLTPNEEEIECNAEKVKGLVLKTCFLKKAQ